MNDRRSGSGYSGVSAVETADTPLALAEGVWARDALQTLEFDAVVERVAALAAGPLGAARVRARRPAADVAAIDRALEGAAQAAALERAGEGLSIPAAPDAGPVLARLALDGSVLEAPDLLHLRRLINSARATARELRRVADEAPLVAELLGPLPPSSIDRALERAVDDDGRLLDSASPALAAARRAVHQARGRLIGRLEKILGPLDGDAAVTVRGGRYVIPVRRDQRDRPAGIVHDESASQGTLFIEPTAAIELGNALREAQVAEERATLKVLRELTETLRPHRTDLASALDMCVAADDLQARARYAARIDGYRPSVAPAPGPLTIRQGRHPLLLDGDTEVVPFSLELEATERTLLVSGPNTGGKTVLLKAVGLMAAMAQSGFIPPLGAGSVVPVFRDCFADIGDHQSIAANLSTYAAHLTALRHTLERAAPHSLVLIDELGSGTDPAEGAALASASLAALTRRGVTTLATTHLGALKELPTRVPGVVNGSLQFDPAHLSPTYRFQKGVPGRSYGLAIGRRLGLDRRVLDEATAALPDAERRLDRLLAAVEEREQEVAGRLSQVEERELAAESREAVAERRAGELAAREEAVAGREREAERSARERARAYLLEARRRVEQALGMARAAVDEATAREARRLVEEGVQEESEALNLMAAGEREAAVGDLPVAVGSRVRLASGITGQVVESRANGRWVVRVGGVHTVVARGDIEGVIEGRDQPPRKAPPAGRPAAPAVATAPLEVDFRGLTGDEAEAATVAAIDGAVLNEQPYLAIIHGMGTGVVRDRVRRVLHDDARVASFAFAPREQGGTGVTIVEFRP